MRLPAIELFAGSGGLAFGLSKAGFDHLAVIESDRDACETMRVNQPRFPRMKSWDVIEADARSFDFSPYAGRAALLAAGAPCQPFSRSGNGHGPNDKRNLFPVIFRALSSVAPDAFLIENVRGLRDRFPQYFEYISEQLAKPGKRLEYRKLWSSHSYLGEKGPSANQRPEYEVHSVALEAADFGAGQRRERLFLVGVRSDLGIKWTPPEPTHSQTSLHVAKWVTKEYWREHSIRPPACVPFSDVQLAKLAATESAQLSRWQTIRDVIRGSHPLPTPREYESPGYVNHIANPGARLYDGHCGSAIDQPAKTLKAGAHGVPGGENTLRHQNGKIRYFTPREAARLQQYPDSYEFTGAWCSVFKQLGNAVPVGLAEIIGRSVFRALERTL